MEVTFHKPGGFTINMPSRQLSEGAGPLMQVRAERSTPTYSCDVVNFIVHEMAPACRSTWLIQSDSSSRGSSKLLLTVPGMQRAITAVTDIEHSQTPPGHLCPKAPSDAAAVFLNTNTVDTRATTDWFPASAWESLGQYQTEGSSKHL